MLIHYDPDEFESVTSSTTCSFHKANPGKAYAGCTCSASFGQRRRSPEEIAAIKLAKRLAHEEQVLAEAAGITARRKCAASADTLPKGQDAKQGLAGTESGAVPEGQTPKGSGQ